MSSFPSTALLGELVDLAPDALVVIDAGGRIILANARAEQLFDYARAELCGMPLEELVPERLRAGHLELRRGHQAATRDRAMEHIVGLTARRRDGTEVPVEISLATFRTEAGVFVAASVREASARERALRDSERRLRAILDEAPIGMAILDLEGRFRQVNRAFCRIVGFEPAELEARAVRDLTHPDDLQAELTLAARVLRGELARYDLEQRYVRKDGSLVDVRVHVSLLRDEAGRPGHVIAQVQDITGELGAQAALARAEAYFREIFERAKDAIFIARVADERITDVNDAGLALLGYTRGELLGMSLAALRAPVDGAAAPGDDRTVEWELVAKDGELVPVEVRATVLPGGRTLAYVRDVRERKRLDAVLSARDRMVTVGTLAAGVGHEINNPLSYLSGNLDYIAEELREVVGGAPGGKLGELLDLVHHARDGAERIRKIVRGLRTFARGEREELVDLDVHAVIDMSISLARSELRAHAQLVTELAPVPTVLGDESRLAQVIINLLTNAAQAMRHRPTDQNVIRLSTARDAAGRVVIEIADSGPGMPPAVSRRIFEPFFTTKPIGQGSGLGLSIAHNIVTGMGGEIRCDTAPGRGTTFRVVLPASDGTAAARAAQARRADGPTRRGRVLVVDDEPMVVATIQRVLGGEHETVAAADGAAALGLLAGDDAFDVVLCDLMMPGMDGIALFRRLGSAWPALARRVVFMTGGATDPKIHEFLDDLPNARLEKPFAIQALRDVVRQLLEASAA